MKPGQNIRLPILFSFQMKQAVATDADLQSLMQAVPTPGVSVPGHVTSSSSIAPPYMEMPGGLPASYTQWIGNATTEPTSNYSRK